jgi:hypothetical protein
MVEGAIPPLLMSGGGAVLLVTLIVKGLDNPVLVLTAMV